MDIELLKKAKFDVEIKSINVDINAKNLSYDETRILIDKIANENKEDLKLQEAYLKNKDTFGFSGVFQGDFKYHISAHMERIQLESQTCPRRMNEHGAWEHSENLDRWDLIGEDKCCSFCGSIHPERLLELISLYGFSIIGSTTKSYKLYINRKEVPNASFGGIKFYSPHFTQEQCDEYNRLLKLSNKSQI